MFLLLLLLLRLSPGGGSEWLLGRMGNTLT